MNIQFLIFQVLVLVFSAIIHEYMHGWMADQLGDPTAKMSGRLTLNPLPHIDPIGSIFLPALLILTNAGFVFGWAKPVPYNPYNLRDAKYGGAKVALAGPLANFITALFFGLILRFMSGLNPTLMVLFAYIVWINLLLMLFNLVPIPPMDGSKILMPFLPASLQSGYASLERFGMILVMVFVLIGFSLLTPLIYWFFNMIVGHSFASFFL